jgi:hypothetical protein
MVTKKMPEKEKDQRRGSKRQGEKVAVLFSDEIDQQQT